MNLRRTKKLFRAHVTEGLTGKRMNGIRILQALKKKIGDQATIRYYYKLLKETDPMF